MEKSEIPDGRPKLLVQGEMDTRSKPLYPARPIVRRAVGLRLRYMGALTETSGALSGESSFVALRDFVAYVEELGRNPSRLVDMLFIWAEALGVCWNLTNLLSFRRILPILTRGRTDPTRWTSGMSKIPN